MNDDVDDVHIKDNSVYKVQFNVKVMLFEPGY